MKDCLIFDAEIVLAIHDPKQGEKIPGIKYCKGWGDYANMGISVVSICWLSDDFTQDDPRHFPQVYDWTDPFERRMAKAILQGADNLGGFNSKRFDDRLFRAHGCEIRSHFDIYDMVLVAAGQKGKNYRKDGFKYNLDEIVRANGMEKTGRGELAPVWWQQGLRDRVIAYCRNDGIIEREVLRLLLAGELIDPNTGNKLSMPEASWESPF